MRDHQRVYLGGPPGPPPRQAWPGAPRLPAGVCVVPGECGESSRPENAQIEAATPEPVPLKSLTGVTFPFPVISPATAAPPVPKVKAPVIAIATNFFLMVVPFMIDGTGRERAGPGPVRQRQSLLTNHRRTKPTDG